MAAGVIHDQRELALLGNVKQAVQGRNEHVPGFVTVPLDAEPPARGKEAAGEDPANVDEHAAGGTPVQVTDSDLVLRPHGEAGRITYAMYHDLLAEHVARQFRCSRQKPPAWSREQLMQDWATLAVDPARTYRLAVEATAEGSQGERTSVDARFEAIEARLEAIESAITGPRDE
jgi:hypothetical protein